MISYDKLKNILLKNRDIPYPNIPHIYANSNYINLLYDLYAGEKASELTAITQYIYQHIDLKKEETISKILKDISIQEMKHLEILGEIIKILGGKPIYKSSKGNMWSAGNVTYRTNSLEQLINNNIKAEEYAIDAYRRIQKYTSNLYLRQIYERIIQDELTHLEIFNLILDDLKRED